jgi:hypothetical protein
MGTDEEPAFDATVSDLGCQRPGRLFGPGPSRPAERWRPKGLVLVACLLGGELFVTARQPASLRRWAKVVPLDRVGNSKPSGAVS